MLQILAQTQSDFPEWLPPTIILPLFALIIWSIRKHHKKKKAEKEAIIQSGLTFRFAFKHIYGLPIAENVLCEISSYPDRLEFKAGNTHVTLARNKITDMCIATDAEIQRQVVSSAGGAVAGAMAFGPLGALIGGRVKTVQLGSIDEYLIITYRNSQEEPAFLGFDVTYNVPCVNKMIKEFKELNTTSGFRIEL